jgi:hypothetical protein
MSYSCIAPTLPLQDLRLVKSTVETEASCYSYRLASDLLCLDHANSYNETEVRLAAPASRYHIRTCSCRCLRGL